MSKPVLLLTDRPAFEQAWRPPLERSGLEAQVTAPESLTDVLRDDTAVVIDGGCELFDEDELLAHVGLARAPTARSCCRMVSDTTASKTYWMIYVPAS